MKWPRMNTDKHGWGLAWLISTVLVSSLLAQHAPVIQSTTQEVLLDLVVRDKKGHVVRDLKPEEITVLDGGQAQKIRGFRLVQGMEAVPGTAQPKLDPLRQIQLVSLVFDRLGPDGRRLSKQAALELLKNESGPNVYFGVFNVDQRLRVLQPFTANRELARKAVDAATGGTSSQFEHSDDSIRRAYETSAGSEGASDAAVGGAQVNGAAMASEQMARMMLDMLEFSETSTREQQGRSSIFSLFGIVREQYRLPGRKTVIYFAEGLQLPNSLEEQLHSMIGAANRANVSVYAVDARGLLTVAQNQGAADMLTGAAKASWRTTTRESEGVTRNQATSMDHALDSLHANVQNALAELAEGTGGFLVANSNDLRTPLRRVEEDMHTYYELSYSPEIEKYDGSFRNIEVTVARPDVKVQTRSGYFALPAIEGQSVQPFEVPLLSALAASPMPRAFAYHAAALHFATPQAEIVLDVPLQEIRFVKDPAAKVYHTHFAALAMFKDAQGRVVSKVSQDVPFDGPLDKLEAFQQGHFVFTRTVQLSPGRYTLETAVMDRESQRVSARKAVFVAEPARRGIGISSLAMIRRVEPGAKDSAHDPFITEAGRVTPSLSDAVSGGPDAKLSLYFVVYPEAGVAEKPKLEMEFLSEGNPLGRGEIELPAPNAEGVIPYIATLPVAHLKPGQYEVQATVKQGTGAAKESAFFTIVN